MAINNSKRIAGPFYGNGITTDFPFNYKVFGRGDVLVATTSSADGSETVLALDADYNVFLNQNQDNSPGGIIRLNNPLPNGATLSATTNVAITQGLDLTNQGGFYPRTISDALDRLTIIAQQMAGGLDRSLKFSFTDTSPTQLPTVSQRKNKLLSFDLNGAPQAIAPISGSAADVLMQLGAAGGAGLVGYMNGGAPLTLDKAIDVLYYGIANVRNPKYAGGAKGDGTSCVAAVRAAIADLKSRGGGLLYFPDGQYGLDAASLINDPSAATSLYRYWFQAESNITVQGGRKAVLRVDNNVIQGDAAKQYAKGYQIFWAYNIATVENFTVRGLTIDCNGVNNLVPARNAYGSAAQTHVVVSNCAKKWRVEGLHVIGTSGYQCVAFYLGATDVEVIDNHFYDMASSIPGNVNLLDHSTVYIECDTYRVMGNRFINANYDTVATCIETHGFNGIVANNYGRRYNLGMLRAAMLGDSYNVTNIGNVFDEVTVGVQFDANPARRLEAFITCNQFRIRDNAGRGTRTPGGVNTAGGFANRTAGNYADIRIVNNEFTAPASITAAGWRFCLGGNVDYLTLKGNRVVGFAKYYEAGNFVDNSAVVAEGDYIEGATGTLFSHATYVASAAAQHVDYHIADLDLAKSPGATAFLSCVYDNANIRNVLITGAYPVAIQPYTGYYNVINTSFRVDITAVSSMASKNVAPFVTGKVYDLAHGALFFRESVTEPERWRIKRALAAAPTAPFAVGDDHQGDIVENIAPVVGGPAGWECTTSSNPGVVGVWSPYGILGAKKVAYNGPSSATDVATLKTDYNNLLQSLRDAGLMT